MPRIREYFARDVKINTGPLQALANAQQENARFQANAIRTQYDAIGDTFKNVGAIVEHHLEQNDTSKLAADAATVQADLNVKWKDTVDKADPNDPDVADKFMADVVGPSLDKMGEGISTQRGQQMYQEMSARIRAGLFEKTAVDQSSMRGSAAVTNLLTLKNKTAESLRLDPTGFNTAVELSRITLMNYGKTFNVPTDKLMELDASFNKEYALTAIRSMAGTNPAAAREAVNSGKFSTYIDGTDTIQALNYIDAQEQAAKVDVKAAEQEKRKADKDAFDAQMTKLSASLVTEDGQEQVPADYFKSLIAASEMPGAEPGTIGAARNAAMAVLRRSEAGTNVVSDPHVLEDFQKRLVLENGDARKLTLKEIFEAEADGSLAPKQATRLKSYLNEFSRNPQLKEDLRQFNKSVTSLKGFITKSSMISNDAAGDERFRLFQIEMERRFRDGLDSGTTAKEMLTPGPKYIFPSGPEFTQWQFSSEQQMNFLMQQGEGTLGPQGLPASMGPVRASQRKQGESLEDYKKRLGLQ